MADAKITDLTELTAPATDDWLEIVDASDTTDDAAGSSRKIKRATLGGDLLGSLTAAEISVTGAVTATIGRMHVCSGTTSDYTVTLPAASGNSGKLIGFRMSPALTKLVTIDGNSSETIDGATTRVMWAQESCILLCDGSNWFKISGKSRPMSCILRRNSNQTGVATDTVTPVQLDTSEIDNTGLMADTANNRIIVRRTANYLVVGTVIWLNLATANASRCISNIQSNGAEIGNGESPGLVGSYPSPPAVKPGALLTAGDLITLHGFQNTGSSQAVYGSNTTSTTSLAVLEQPQW